MHHYVKFLIIISSIYFFLMSCTKKMTEEELVEKALKIHEKVLTIDSHVDVPLNLFKKGWNIGEYNNINERGKNKIDLLSMADGRLDAAFFAVYVGQSERTPQGYTAAMKRADVLIDTIQNICQNSPDLVELAAAPNDVYRIERLDKRAVFMGMENGYPVGKDLSLIQYFYNRGIRYMTLCHTRNNDICDSSTDRKGPEWNGLSSFGENVVREMNRIGMIIDASHVSDSAFYDVLEITEAPVIASHSCCRTLCDNPRNLSDVMLKALAENEGIIQINLVPFYLIDEEYPGKKASLKDAIDHIDHVVQLIGIDHVGIGTDFNGGGGVEGCDDVSELPNITIELVRRGYTKNEIRKIWGGNLLRVFREVIKIAEQIKSS